jgi:hypothetical protein
VVANFCCKMDGTRPRATRALCGGSGEATVEL